MGIRIRTLGLLSILDSESETPRNTLNTVRQAAKNDRQ